ncbi:transposase [Streptomyces sp. NPDC127077]|uniref:transposase n=1 Tax=Streptomyces sp. NPDC127077 TaxID=3347131 RepID=UPI00366A1576
MMPAVSADLSKRLVPDELWELVAPLQPSFAARPQGGGTAPRDERAVFTAVVYVLTSGCAWRHLPPMFGTSSATAHRRFTVWTEVGLWRRLHRAVLDELGVRGEVDWTSGIIDAAVAGVGEAMSFGTAPHRTDGRRHRRRRPHPRACRRQERLRRGGERGSSGPLARRSTRSTAHPGREGTGRRPARTRCRSAATGCCGTGEQPIDRRAGRGQAG